MALLRRLLKFLKDGDILLGDAIFENYFLIAMPQLGNIDVMFEKNGAHHLDLRKCDQNLGKEDGLMRLTKPSRPEWMSRDFYNQWVPNELTIRVIKNKKRTIVTTLLNPEQYPKRKLSVCTKSVGM